MISNSGMIIVTVMPKKTHFATDSRKIFFRISGVSVNREAALSIYRFRIPRTIKSALKLITNVIVNSNTPIRNKIR